MEQDEFEQQQANSQPYPITIIPRHRLAPHVYKHPAEIEAGECGSNSCKPRNRPVDLGVEFYSHEHSIGRAGAVENLSYRLLYLHVTVFILFCP